MGQLPRFILILLAVTLVGCAERTKRLKWNLKTTVEDYTEAGKRDPKWDEPALKALKLFAQWRSSSAMQTQAIGEQIATAAGQSVAAGCKDPLILYVYARFVVNKTGRNENEIAFAHKRAADALKGS